MFVEQNLEKKYSRFRRTRGDGNCFYRAFGFAYMELLLQDQEELARFVIIIFIIIIIVCYHDI